MALRRKNSVERGVGQAGPEQEVGVGALAVAELVQDRRPLQPQVAGDEPALDDRSLGDGADDPTGQDVDRVPPRLGGDQVLAEVEGVRAEALHVADQRVAGGVLELPLVPRPAGPGEGGEVARLRAPSSRRAPPSGRPAARGAATPRKANWSFM